MLYFIVLFIDMSWVILKLMSVCIELDLERPVVEKIQALRQHFADSGLKNKPEFKKMYLCPVSDCAPEHNAV